MFDDITRGYLNYAVRHIPQCLWRLVREVNRDGDADRHELCRNLVCSMPDSSSKPYAAEIEWIRRNGMNVDFTFPYNRRELSESVRGGVDSGLNLPYVEHKGQKLFFPKGDLSLALKAYSILLHDEGITGQGLREKSPHSYVSDDFNTSLEDVLLDVGCAEALFALDKVTEVKKVYLFEGLKKWRKPLETTFAPFSDKTILLSGFVGDGSRGTYRLQDVVKEPDNTTYFIKMDIEGAERQVIRASSEFLKTHRVKLSCCVYHRQDDAKVIGDMLTDLGFRWTFSNGWMLPDFNGFHFPYFRHGVIRARNW